MKWTTNTLLVLLLLCSASCDGYEREMLSRHQGAIQELDKVADAVVAYYELKGSYPEKIDQLIPIHLDSLPSLPSYVFRNAYAKSEPPSKDSAPFTLCVSVRSTAAMQSADVLIYCPKDWINQYQSLTIYDSIIETKAIDESIFVDENWVRLDTNAQNTLGLR